MAVHVDDAYSSAQTNALADLLEIVYFPSLVFDMDKTTLFNEQNASRLTAYVDKMSAKDACGIAISWKSGKVNVKVKAAVSGTYNLTVAVVEDKVISTQQGYGSNYENRSLVRDFLTSSAEGVSLGTLKAGAEASKTFPRAAAENQRIVAYVLKVLGHGLGNTYLPNGDTQFVHQFQGIIIGTVSRPESRHCDTYNTLTVKSQFIEGLNRHQ